MIRIRLWKPCILFFAVLYLAGSAITSVFPVNDRVQNRGNNGAEILLLGESTPVTALPSFKSVPSDPGCIIAHILPLPQADNCEDRDAGLFPHIQDKFPRWSSSTFL